MARSTCTELCTKPKTGHCTLCGSLDAADAFWRRSGLAMLGGWLAHFGRSIADEGGYRIVVDILAAVIGVYAGVYAIVEARHERQMNRALFAQNRLMTLVHYPLRIGLAALILIQQGWNPFVRTYTGTASIMC